MPDLEDARTVRPRLALRSGRLTGAILAAALSALTPAAAQDRQDGSGQQAAGAAFVAEAAPHWNALETYCFECHNFIDWAGGLALDIFSPETVAEEAETWEKVVRKLRGRTMPPPGEDRPSDARYSEIVTWLEGYLDHAAAAEPNPGWTGVHRLNRKEYANAVYDLLGVDWIASVDMLPPDTAYEGFDNIASALVTTPGFMEMYLSTARQVAVEAVGRPDAPLGTGSAEFLRLPDQEGHQAFHVHGAPLGTRGGIQAWHYFPSDGEYEINLEELFPTDAWLNAAEYFNTLIVTVDGRLVYTANLGGEETGDLRHIDQDQGPAVTDMNHRLQNIRFEVEAGPRLVSAAYLFRSFMEGEHELSSLNPMGGTERHIAVTGFNIVGPFGAHGIGSTPSRAKIFSCYPKARDEESACAREILSGLATRAFRRPVQGHELDIIMSFYATGLVQGGFEEGIRSGVTRILASPQFLYRAVDPAPEREVAAGSGIYWMSDLELASRLSFFLWSTIPDDELLEVAAAGSLRDQEVLEAQVMRMLADPRSFSLASSFAYQWLHLDKIDDLEPDPNVFPYAANHRLVLGSDADPRKDLLQETLLFVDMIFRDDRSVVDLLSATDAYLNERAAIHYGIDTVKGDRFRRVELERSARWGLLGKAAVLMVTSYPDRTAPVLRGEWILANIVGAPPAAPPPDVEALLPENDFNAEVFMTVAERLAAHSTEPSCFACHGLMDPLGFALENFNAVGVWREVEEFTDQPVVTDAGVLPDGTPVTSPDALREYLLQRPEQFVQTFTEKLFMYALGRPLDYVHDMPVIRSIVNGVVKDDYRFSSLVMAIVASAPFQQGKPPSDETLTAFAMPANGNSDAPLAVAGHHAAAASRSAD
jgi:hypothetical protein